MSDSLRPRELYSPWNFLGQNTGVGNLSLVQGIFPTPWLNPGLLHWGRILYKLSHQGSLESEKAGLKLNIQKTKIMASGHITSWLIDGETVADFIFLGSKITADGDFSHEIKRRLLLGRKVMTNLDSTLKSRDITLPTKVPLVKAVVFPVVMYQWESWIIKKAEHWRIDALNCGVGEDSWESHELQGDQTSQS